LPITSFFLLVEPLFKLFGRVGGSVIENEGHGMHLTTQG
jgi:hypothetical protein